MYDGVRNATGPPACRVSLIECGKRKKHEKVREDKGATEVQL